MLDSIALDKYSFVRDAYLARRLRLVFDGNPPEDYEIKPPAKPKQ
jgi:phospholipid-binding lipoprotein MlaA